MRIVHEELIEQIFIAHLKCIGIKFIGQDDHEQHVNLTSRHYSIVKRNYYEFAKSIYKQLRRVNVQLTMEKLDFAQKKGKCKQDINCKDIDANLTLTSQMFDAKQQITYCLSQN